VTAIGQNADADFPVTFRAANIHDADELAALVNSCYRGDSSRRGWTTEADMLDGSRTDREEILSLITTPGSMVLLCSDQNAIIGSVHVRQEGSSCYLGMLVVNPVLQGGGLGSQLMQTAENHARQVWASEKMTMSVISSRSELIAYYERRGYRRTGEMKPFVIDDVHGIPRIEGIEFEVLEKVLDK
jgi:ribosomal protein S18 acetylase RimI-like enzyme